jgi:peptide/nickel transport system permease protein
LWASLKYLILPAITLGFAESALISRVTRSTMLEVLSEDYVRTARSKGLRESLIVGKHALRNALIPILTVVGLALAQMLGGAVVTETVFTLPGVGRLVISSVGRRDYPVIQGVILVVAAIYVLVNLLIDLLYVIVDPRVKY